MTSDRRYLFWCGAKKFVRFARHVRSIAIVRLLWPSDARVFVAAVSAGCQRDPVAAGTAAWTVVGLRHGRCRRRSPARQRPGVETPTEGRLRRHRCRFNWSTEAISSNSTRKLLFEITKMLIAVFKIKFIVLFTIIFGTLSSLWHYGVKFAQNGASTGDTRWACAQNDTPRSSTGATAAFDTHDCLVLVFRFLLLEKL